MVSKKKILKRVKAGLMPLPEWMSNILLDVASLPEALVTETAPVTSTTAAEPVISVLDPVEPPPVEPPAIEPPPVEPPAPKRSTRKRRSTKTRTSTVPRKRK